MNGGAILTVLGASIGAIAVTVAALRVMRWYRESRDSRWFSRENVRLISVVDQLRMEIRALSQTLDERDLALIEARRRHDEIEAEYLALRAEGDELRRSFAVDRNVWQEQMCALESDRDEAIEERHRIEQSMIQASKEWDHSLGQLRHRLNVAEGEKGRAEAQRDDIRAQFDRYRETVELMSQAANEAIPFLGGHDER